MTLPAPLGKGTALEHNLKNKQKNLFTKLESEQIASVFLETEQIRQQRNTDARKQTVGDGSLFPTDTWKYEELSR